MWGASGGPPADLLASGCYVLCKDVEKRCLGRARGRRGGGGGGPGCCCPPLGLGTPGAPGPAPGSCQASRQTGDRQHSPGLGSQAGPRASELSLGEQAFQAEVDGACGCSRRWEGVWVGPGWPPERSRRLGGAGPPSGRSLRRSPLLCFSHAEAQAAGAGQRTRPSPSSQAQPCRRRCFQSPASSTCHRCRLRPWTLQALSPLVPWPWALLVTVREGQGPPDASPERLSPPGPSAHEAGAACRGPSSREPPCPRRRPGLVPGLVPPPPRPAPRLQLSPFCAIKLFVPHALVPQCYLPGERRGAGRGCGGHTGRWPLRSGAPSCPVASGSRLGCEGRGGPSRGAREVCDFSSTGP